MISKAIAKHGADSFEVRELASDMDAKLALWLEAEMIAQLGTRAPGGYNLTAGGEHALHHPSTKLLLSKAARNVSPERRARLSLAARNRSAETLRRISESKRGKRRSVESIAKQSASAKGTKKSEGHKQAIAQALRGRRQSETSRDKRRATMEGRYGARKVAALELYSAGLTTAEIATKLGEKYGTIWKWLKAAREVADGAT